MQGMGKMASRVKGQSEGEGTELVKCRRGRRWRIAAVVAGIGLAALAGWVVWREFAEPPEPMLAGMRASEMFPLWKRPMVMYPAQKDVVITA